MRVVNILHHSPFASPGADPIREASFEHHYAIALQKWFPEVEYECWRPQRLIGKVAVYRDEYQIIHRVFPSRFLRFNVEYSSPLLRALRRERADGSVGIIFHGAYNLHMCAVAPAISRFPNILQSHGGFPARVMMRRSHRFFGRFLYLAIAGLEKRAMRRFANIFAISTREQRYLQRFYNLRNVCFSPAGLDFDLFKPRDRQSARGELAIPRDRIVVLYVGRLAAEKGLLYLADAFNNLHRSDPRVELYLLGHGPLERELRDYAVRHAIPMTCVGYVEPERLPTWYSASDVFVMPSPIEWFGMAIAEALACGVPVVASRAGGAVDNVGIFESGQLVAPDSSLAIAQAVQATLRSGVPRPNIDKAREVIGWEATARRIMTRLFGGSDDAPEV